MHHQLTGLVTIVTVSSLMLCYVSQGPVARSTVNVNHWLRTIDSDPFLWKLTLVSANLASNDSGVISKVLMVRRASYSVSKRFYALHLFNSLSRHTLKKFACNKPNKTQ